MVFSFDLDNNDELSHNPLHTGESSPGAVSSAAPRKLLTKAAQPWLSIKSRAVNGYSSLNR